MIISCPFSGRSYGPTDKEKHRALHIAHCISLLGKDHDNIIKIDNYYDYIINLIIVILINYYEGTYIL